MSSTSTAVDPTAKTDLATADPTSDDPATADAVTTDWATTVPGGAELDAANCPAERVRRAVLHATLARDLATKVACWDEYRAARDEALAVLAAGPVADAREVQL